MTVIPLRGRATERTLALLLVRPTPGSDDGEGLAARAHARFDASEGAFWAAVLLDPGRRSGEGELFLSAEAPWMRRAEEVARAASAGPAPVLVVGPGGSGRRALTRWLDAVATGSPCSGGRFLDLDRREAAQTLESDLDGRERPWLLTTEPRESLLARGVIPPALARRLHPESIEVPPLAARRAEIPGLARALAARAARLLGRPLPAWSDEALALLFRQAWSGHLSELGTRVAEIVGQSEERVVASDVRAVLARTGAAPVERLSARPGDLAAAVEATRHRSGKANLARAARYLGWAPETLAAHLARTSRAGASRARAP
jgi:DNA-binding NtrC family response regulator